MAKIHPEVNMNNVLPTVKFREAQELINLSVELPKVLHNNGWEIGTIFFVEFINHERTKLLKVARFVVSSDETALQVLNPDSRSPMTKDVSAIEAKQMENWFYPNGVPASELMIDWNVGDKKHNIMHGDKIIASFDKKPEAEKYLKEAA